MCWLYTHCTVRRIIAVHVAYGTKLGLILWLELRYLSPCVYTLFCLFVLLLCSPSLNPAKFSPLLLVRYHLFLSLKCQTRKAIIISGFPIPINYLSSFLFFVQSIKLVLYPLYVLMNVIYIYLIFGRNKLAWIELSTPLSILSNCRLCNHVHHDMVKRKLIEYPAHFEAFYSWLFTRILIWELVHSGHYTHITILSDEDHWFPYR